ncbi:MAG: ABC transporter permease, partial [Nitrosopumilus sp.]|nr:ABC transporter permease [Nitrosopumilus sp.]
MSSTTVSEIKKEFLKSKIGITGIIILAILVITSIGTMTAIPVDTFKEWNNPSNWISYPKV